MAYNMPAIVLNALLIKNSFNPYNSLSEVVMLSLFVC